MENRSQAKAIMLLRQFGIFFLLIVSYVLPRLILIFNYPIFNDEALTIRYSQLMITSSDYFYTLAVGGKPPLLFWIDGVVGMIVDPLIGARMVSLISGALNLLLIYIIVRRLTNHSIGLVGGFLYAISPLAIFYDSLGIHDSFVSLVYSLVIYFLLFSEAGKQELLRSFFLGLALGVGLWVKPTVVVFVLVALCVKIARIVFAGTDRTNNLLAAIVLVNTIMVLTLPLLLRPEFNGVIAMQSEYSQTPDKLLTLPWQRWLGNLQSAMYVFVGYISPVSLAIAVFCWLGTARYNSKLRELALYFLLTLFLLMIFANGLHSRYLVFLRVPIYIIVAVVSHKRKYLAGIGLFSQFILSAILTVSPARFFTMFPAMDAWHTDAFQYVRGWPSGYGVMEALRQANHDRGEKPAFIGVRWDAGNPEDAVLVYAQKLSGVTTAFFDKRLPSYRQILDDFVNQPKYLITRENQRGDMDDILELVGRFQKPYGGEFVELYKVKDSKIR